MNNFDCYMQQQWKLHTPLEMLVGAFRRSEEYCALVAPFLQEVKEVEETFWPLLTDPAAEYAAAEACVVRQEYGKGGILFHRGWYHPDPVEDCLISNATRGRLCKNRPASMPDFIYGFNQAGQLVAVERPASDDGGVMDREFIRYDGDTALGLRFTVSSAGTVHPMMATYCQYDGDRIARMVKGTFYGTTELRFPEITEFVYPEKGVLLRTVTIINGNASDPSVAVFRKGHWCSCDEHGRVSGCKLVWDNGKPV